MPKITFILTVHWLFIQRKVLIIEGNSAFSTTFFCFLLASLGCPSSVAYLRGGGAWGTRAPPYFWTKLRPEGPKKFFFESPPPPSPPPRFLSWGLDPALILILLVHFDQLRHTIKVVCKLQSRILAALVAEYSLKSYHKRPILLKLTIIFKILYSS